MYIVLHVIIDILAEAKHTGKQANYTKKQVINTYTKLNV